MLRRVGVLMLMLGLAGCGSVAAVTDFVLPPAESWDRWAAHDPISTIHVNHESWGAFLTRYRRVDGEGAVVVAYRDVTAADRVALENYIDALSVTPVSTLNRQEQMAYWVNLYNALTVRLILDHYPIDSIREIEFSRNAVPSFVVSDGPWGEVLIMVEEFPLSLDNIEQHILRPLFNEPRVHYVLNRAAVGSPDTMAEPLDPGRLDEQLNEAARRFVNSPRAVMVDGDRAGVSSMYTWFRQDFGGTQQAVLDHLALHARGDLLRALDQVSMVRDQGFDWSLNDTP